MVDILEYLRLRRQEQFKLLCMNGVPVSGVIDGSVHATLGIGPNLGILEYDVARVEPGPNRITTHTKTVPLIAIPHELKKRFQL